MGKRGEERRADGWTGETKWATIRRGDMNDNLKKMIKKRKENTEKKIYENSKPCDSTNRKFR